MHAREAFEILSGHIPQAVKAGILLPGDRVSIRNGSDMWITRVNADLGKLKAGDVLHFPAEKNILTGDPITDLHAYLYASHSRLGALILCGLPFCRSLSRTGETVRPYVDDIAQIIGISIKCVDIGDWGKVSAQFKRRNAVLIRGAGALCADTNLDDALAVAMIAEKACAIHVLGSYIGGVKAINAAESALMHFVYLKMYSKQTVKK